MQHHWQKLVDGNVKTPTTPADLWEQSVVYFNWCDTNPIIQKKTILIGRDVGRKVEEENPRPYTLKGLCIHTGLSENYFKDIKNSNTNSMYYAVVMRILYIIYVQNQELATVGVFSPIFTSKMLGMDKEEDTQKTEFTVRVVALDGISKLSNSESEVMKKIELEGGEPVIRS